ncbi:Uma2 family endonuclease [Spirulina sp. CCNP1310]|uniref:Uma2 family endonuclease n=1 Tax=Spirulina sp. CCNP1310 TaxID=3110249 RepID=UPI002B204E92|nr:Uma2 family endonuclease [Spirulina sp. CCNP1310]MEA5419451.1 Uma2 family endonuclease [Spirulina sp. CCNP1310]
MVATVASTQSLSLAEFLAMPPGDQRYEFYAGAIAPKMAPKRIHAGLQKKLLQLIDPWAVDRGHFYPEWAVLLTREGQPWVPVPDLTYVAFERLGADWFEDEACPVPPDWVMEIISPGQSFGAITAKALAYLEAGVLRVWVVDGISQTITVFGPDRLPQIFGRVDVITDPALLSFTLSLTLLFSP